MTGAELLHRRLANQYLVGPTARAPVIVVRRLGAVQAQDYPGARWAIAQRCGDVTAADIDALLEKGRLLRTHVLRPTWHIVLPEDIRWMLRLTGPRIVAAMAGRHRQLGLDASLVRRGEAAVYRALADGPLTRPEIAAACKGAGLDLRGERLGHLLGLAEVNEVIVSGGKKGKQQTHMRLDDRVPQLHGFKREDALTEIARRYFVGHAPARDVDLAWWAGLTLTDARHAIAGAGLRAFDVGGKTFWQGARKVAALEGPVVHLLPNYDEYDVAYQDHQPNQHDIVAARPRAVGALVPHIVAIDGVVTGGWRRTLGAKGIHIKVSLVRKLNRTERAALENAALAYGRHLGDLPVTVSGG